MQVLFNAIGNLFCGDKFDFTSNNKLPVEILIRIINDCGSQSVLSLVKVNKLLNKVTAEKCVKYNLLMTIMKAAKENIGLYCYNGWQLAPPIPSGSGYILSLASPSDETTYINTVNNTRRTFYKKIEFACCLNEYDKLMLTAFYDIKGNRIPCGSFFGHTGYPDTNSRLCEKDILAYISSSFKDISINGKLSNENQKIIEEVIEFAKVKLGRINESKQKIANSLDCENFKSKLLIKS